MAFLEAFFARWAAGGDAGSTAASAAFREALEAALDRTGARERRDVLALIDGPWIERGSNDGSGRAARPVPMAGGGAGGVPSGLRSAPCAGPPADRPGVPVHA